MTDDREWGWTTSLNGFVEMYKFLKNARTVQIGGYMAVSKSYSRERKCRNRLLEEITR